MPDQGPAQDTLLEFPCAFPLKIMGLASDGLAQAVLEVVLRHAPDFDGATMGMRLERRQVREPHLHDQRHVETAARRALS